jgi:hypothetical protein
MRVKYLTPAIVMLMLLFWSIESRAQDEVPGPDLNGTTTVTDPNSYDEKPLLFESEGKTSKQATDTTSTRAPVIAPARKTAVPEAKKKEESDPLNFNFLFYIIQTFKASDLMMEN